MTQGISSAILYQYIIQYPPVFKICEVTLFVDRSTQNVINILNSVINTSPNIHWNKKWEVPSHFSALTINSLWAWAYWKVLWKHVYKIMTIHLKLLINHCEHYWNEDNSYTGRFLDICLLMKYYPIKASYIMHQWH